MKKNFVWITSKVCMNEKSLTSVRPYRTSIWSSLWQLVIKIHHLPTYFKKHFSLLTKIHFWFSLISDRRFRKCSLFRIKEVRNFLTYVVLLYKVSSHLLFHKRLKKMFELLQLLTSLRPQVRETKITAQMCENIFDAIWFYLKQ